MCEIEMRPDVDAILLGSSEEQLWDETWPSLISLQAKVQSPSLEPEHLYAVWQGDRADMYGEKAIIATIALAVRGLGKTHVEALQQAEQIWQARSKNV